MDEEKSIKELAQDIGKSLAVTNEYDRLPFTLHTCDYLAKELVKAGYHKVDTDTEKDIIHSHAPKLKKDIPMPPVKPAPATNCNKQQKTRENELHEPKIKVTPFTGMQFFRYQATAFCSVCHGPIISRSSDTEYTAEFYTKVVMPNYCPHCGARLKEVAE